MATNTVSASGKEIGFVRQVIGEVKATASDGVVRTLQVGDLVFADELIETGGLSSIEIVFNDGGNLSLGRNSQGLLDADVYETVTPEDGSEYAASIDAIQQAILLGEDPAAIQEAPAAGSGEAAGNEGTSFVTVERTGAQTTPESGFETEGLTLSISDGEDLASLNAPPIAEDDEAVIDEDTPINISVLGNDRDPSGDPISVVEVTQGVHGSVSIDTVTGNPVYTPNPNYNGSDSFTYTISDGAGGLDTATVTVAIDPVNDAPVASTIRVEPDGTTLPDPNSVGAGNYEHTIPEDTSVSGLVMATDVDGDILVYTQNSNPSHGTAVVNPDGSYTYTPDQDYNGNDSFEVLVDDGNGGTAIATVYIIITPVQDPSLITAGSGSVTEDTILSTSGQLAISDADGPQDEAFTPQSNVAGAHGTFSIDGNGNWRYNLNNSDPAVQALDAGERITEVFTVTGVDGTPSTVTVMINGVNENSPPNALNDSVSTREDTPVTFHVLGNDSDPDADPLTVTGFTQPANGTLTQLSNGTFEYTPDLNFFGVDAFTYTITDGVTGSATARVNINVGGVAESPTAADDSAANPVLGAPIIVDVLSNDSDPDGNLDPSSVQIVGSANPGDSLAVPGEGTWTVNPTSGAIMFTPESGFNSDPTPIEYIVSDNEGNPSNPATVTVSYGDGPVAGNDASSGNMINMPVTVDVLINDSDPDGSLDPSSVQIVGTANPGDPLPVPGEGAWTVNATTGAITFTPESGFRNDPSSISYTVDDNDGNTSNTATVTIDYTSPPVAMDDGAATFEDTPIAVDALSGLLSNDTDPDGESFNLTQFEVGGLTYAAGDTATIAGVGSLQINADGSYSFSPTTHYSGIAPPVNYTIVDGSGDTASATLTLETIAVADTPNLIVTSDSFSNTADFESVNLGSRSWGAVDHASVGGGIWDTANSGGLVEVGMEFVYLRNGVRDNQVIELEHRRGDTSNFFTDLAVNEGEVYTLNFDYAARAGAFTHSAIELFWEGNLIATLDTRVAALQSFNFNLLASATGNARLEFRAVDTNSVGGLLDNISLNLQQNTGYENQPINLPELMGTLIDMDGSETLTFSISGIPADSILTDGVHAFPAAPGVSTVDVTGWNLDNLQLTPPTGFNGGLTLEYRATATEASNGSQATRAEDVQLTILPANGGPVVDPDDRILFDATSALIDGGDGNDTLLVPGNDDLDFSNVNTIRNMEQIDLTAGDHAITNLSAADVVDMTDEDNLLKILGDSSDSVELSSDWHETGNSHTHNGHVFAEYLNTQGSAVLLIEDQVNVTIM
ncbi:MAG: retention module-containing protein [Candidatus Thiodiazotropha endolucinida]|uniref:Retention module-containing protein n=1 Tax=Candidatus Thiodiazotropha taylori TaxID=2792791 RepID=A0A9E4TT52_9GAMM|nr:retention module-containing protein [Candidatus Thiodiazotropha taylori]MCW4237028.1 retention module-containing protein [Candidatus Thiodiazotropha endolucinida]